MKRGGCGFRPSAAPLCAKSTGAFGVPFRPAFRFWLADSSGSGFQMSLPGHRLRRVCSCSVSVPDVASGIAVGPFSAVNFNRLGSLVTCSPPTPSVPITSSFA